MTAYRNFRRVSMRRSSLVIAAAAIAVVSAVSTAKPAKADGGVLLGVGIYLVTDLVVGKKCHIPYFPFNIVKKVAYGLKGVPVCKYGHRRAHYARAYKY
jgi:hypothetical protein